MRRLRSSLTYANVVSTVCLFVVLGGSAYAGALLTGRNVKNESLTGADIRNGSLTAREFRAASLLAGAQGPKGETGAKGDAGPKGDIGAAGPQGDSGPTGATGPQGAQGQAGITSETAPSGYTMRGIWVLTESNQVFGSTVSGATAISFPFRLAQTPTFHPLTHWRIQGDYTTDCPGYDAGLPQAAAGHLCIYQTNADLSSGIGIKTAQWNKLGIWLSATSAANSALAGEGTWAVTVP